MSDSTRFDKILQKFQDLKGQLDKAKVEVNLGMPAKKGKTATNEYVEKYDESRQDGANVDPELTAQEKAKKAEYLAMSQHGQWSLHKADGKSQGSNPPKSENRKRAEKEIKDHSPTGEDPEKGAEEVDSAQIKRKYRAGEGSGASINRLHKSDDEPHKDDPHHEKKEKKIADDIKGKAKEFLDMHHGKEEPHKDDPHHEAKEKKAAKDIKGKAEKIKDLHKADEHMPGRGPASHYDPKSGLTVTHMGKDDHGNHGYDIRHKGKSIASASVQKQPKGTHVVDIHHDGNISDEHADHADTAVHDLHRRLFPQHKMELDEPVSKMDDMHKADEDDLSKSLESKLKMHPGVHKVTVERNHPDHPGHSYVSVEHDETASGHVNHALNRHGKVDHDTADKIEGKHPKSGKQLYETQAIVKPFPRAPKPDLKIVKMDDATTLQGPIEATVATKMDEGSPMSGDYHATGIEKKDLPKDAEYQKHIKREPKDMGKSRQELIDILAKNNDHHKQFFNLNPHLKHYDHADHLNDMYRESEEHHAKTGKALKFPASEFRFETRHEEAPGTHGKQDLAGPSKKLP